MGSCAAKWAALAVVALIVGSFGTAHGQTTDAADAWCVSKAIVAEYFTALDARNHDHVLYLIRSGDCATLSRRMMRQLRVGFIEESEGWVKLRVLDRTGNVVWTSGAVAEKLRVKRP